MKQVLMLMMLAGLAGCHKPQQNRAQSLSSGCFWVEYEDEPFTELYCRDKYRSIHVGDNLSQEVFAIRRPSLPVPPALKRSN